VFRVIIKVFRGEEILETIEGLKIIRNQR